MIKMQSIQKDENEEKVSRRADILFPSMQEKKNNKIGKNTSLGNSIYDEDVKVNGKQSNNKTENLLNNSTKQNIKHSRAERTAEEEEQLLDLMYPTMKDKKTQDKIKV